MRHVLPILQRERRRFEKYQHVHARPARPGEVVVSVTGDGEESSATASEGDMVVRNLTAARELYVVSHVTFAARYTDPTPVEGAWQDYAPRGEVLALEVTRDITSLLDVGAEFFLMAPWGEKQLARAGDMLVTPLPAHDEVYRIARAEFQQTYREAKVRS